MYDAVKISASSVSATMNVVVGSLTYTLDAYTSVLEEFISAMLLPSDVYVPPRNSTIDPPLLTKTNSLTLMLPPFVPSISIGVFVLKGAY